MSEEHGWVGGKYYARLADVPCAARCGAPATSWRGWCDEHSADVCGCGHVWLDHHGCDPSEGCMGVLSRLLPPCPCPLTASEVVPAHA